MNINKDYISANNTYSGITPKYIVIHNTDNFAKGANALAHAKAQREGSFQGMSCHFYTDDSDTVYQAANLDHGCWHVGVNYGGRLFGICSNRNSIGIEMCVQSGYDYDKAFANTIALCKWLMQQTGIDAAHVVQHYDVCAKDCPSQIRAKGDWERFKAAISNNTIEPDTGVEWYRIRKSWAESQTQIGAYKDLQKAKDACPEGYCIYDNSGAVVYSNLGESAEDGSDIIGDVTALNIAKVIQAEFGIAAGKNYNCLLGVAQCMKDMLENGQYGNTLSEVLKNNFTAPTDAAADDCIRAVKDVFLNGVKRFDGVKILQYRSFSNYSDGNGNPDPEKCAELLEEFDYLGNDCLDNNWGHLYFGHKASYCVQVTVGSMEEAEQLQQELKNDGYYACIERA